MSDEVQGEIDAVLHGTPLDMPDGEEEVEEVEEETVQLSEATVEELEDAVEGAPSSEEEESDVEGEEGELTQEEYLAAVERQRDQLLATLNKYSEERLRPATNQEDDDDTESPAIAQLTDEQFEDIISSKEAFTNYLSNVLGTFKQSVGASLNTAVSKNLVAREKVHRFFQAQDNDDVRPVANLVIQRAMEIETADPASAKKGDLSQTLAKAAKEIRESLGLANKANKNRKTNQAAKVKANANRFPSAAKANRPAASKKKLDAVAAEIEEMSRAFTGR